MTPTAWPPWLVMWVLAAAIFAACKALTWWRAPVSGAPTWRHAAFLLSWPGLDAGAFIDTRPLPPERRPRLGEWAFAAGKLALGVVLMWVAVPLVPTTLPVLRGWVGMIGLIFLLHFGTFHLVSCAWRAAGVEARPLMDWPVLSVSASEFWGRRWNTAFRDLTHRFLFRPLVARLGPRSGIAAGFLFSGLVHELVISVPARGGFGGPTVYFVVQGLGLLAERSNLGKALGLGKEWPGWLFTAFVVAGPAFALFHQPFVLRVVLPFLEAVGAA